MSKDYTSWDGILVILAYPEEMVSMIPKWYKKPMEWVGMVKNNKISAGHAACILIHKSTGELYYADFGRYITPFGYGRTRTKLTDPEVEFDFEVEINDKGILVNKTKLLQHIYQQPSKTHGGNVMYASFNEKIDYEKCRNFIDDLNYSGSIIYDPFKSDASNCSRFVYDALLAGMTEKKDQNRLQRKSIVTASPLGNVFFGSQSKPYRIKNGKLKQINGGSITTIIQYLFKYSEEDNHEHDFTPEEHMHFLGGVGDQAYFYFSDVSKADQGLFKAVRTNPKGEQIFEYTYRLADQGFDVQKEYQFVHDCNALWLTVKQGDKTYRFERVFQAKESH